MLQRVLTSPSKTLAISLAVFCFGILVAPVVPSPWWEAMLVLMTVSIVGALLLKDKTHRFVCVLLAIFFFALFRVTSAVLPANLPTVAGEVGVSTRVSGVVATEVERRVSTQRIVLEDVAVADTDVAGRLLVWALLYPEIDYGDRVVFNCRLERPEPIEGFAYDAYLESQGILAVCMRPEYVDVQMPERASVIGALLEVKQFFVRRLHEMLPEPHASFLAGLLFGGSSSLASDVKDDFSATGTSHILAASGFNVSLFSHPFLSWILGTRIGRRRGLMLTTMLVITYVLMAGATPAVVRAGFMAGAIILSKGVSRRASILNVLLLTVSLMFVLDPFVVRDVGFQLSCAATGGILAFSDRVGRHLAFIPETFSLRTSFAASLSAIVVTLPILLWHFGTISLIAPFANLLVLPLVPYAMWLTIFALFAVSTFGTNVSFLALPVWALSWFMLWLISAFGAIPFASVSPAYAQLIAVTTFGTAVAFFVYRTYVAR
jgi:competence protein ComEC